MSENGAGLWRDGEWLVVDRRNVRFPNRCLWTNTPVTEPPTRLRVTYREEVGWAFQIWPGLIYAYGPAQNAELNIPTSADWRGNDDARFRSIGWIILTVSLSMVAFAVLAAVLITPDPESPFFNAILALSAIPGGLGVMGTLVGLGWPFIEAPTSRHAPLTVPLLTDRFIWLPRVHSGILTAAPAWPNAPLAEQKPRPTTLGEAVARDYPVLILLVILAAAMITWKLWNAGLLG